MTTQINKRCDPSTLLLAAIGAMLAVTAAMAADTQTPAGPSAKNIQVADKNKGGSTQSGTITPQGLQGGALGSQGGALGSKRGSSGDPKQTPKATKPQGTKGQ
jgi:hypothetical protein